jgi:hypothetical protein
MVRGLWRQPVVVSSCFASVRHPWIVMGSALATPRGQKEGVTPSVALYLRARNFWKISSRGARPSCSQCFSGRLSEILMEAVRPCLDVTNHDLYLLVQCGLLWNVCA